MTEYEAQHGKHTPRHRQGARPSIEAPPGVPAPRTSDELRRYGPNLTEAAIRVQAEWACWANATAVRELDLHDCVSPGAHPGDNIAPLIAVAQQMGCDGAALVRAIAVAYEVQVALVKGMPLAPTQKEQTGHLCPATTAGLGALLGLPVSTIYQALNQSVLLAFSPRQTRTGDMTSWKAFVPGYSGKLAIEAMDRAMRGEASPSPVYEGESGVIAG